MDPEPTVQAMPEKKGKKKRIAIMEPHEELGMEKRRETKVYRKSVFPGIHESFDLAMSGTRRQSSTGMIFNNLMGSSFPSMASRRWTSRRSTMYMSPRFQNNYRLESRHPFNRERVQFIVEHYLNSFLGDHKYNPRRAKLLAENLSIELRDMIKRCNFERYRVVAIVTVGDKNSQDYRSSMRFIWDAEKDGYVNYSFEAQGYFLIATILAVYYE